MDASVMSLADEPLSLALAGTVLAAVGAAAVVRLRSSASADGSADRTGEASADEGAGDRTAVAFDERIGEATLERLEPIAPDAVERVRELEADDHRPAGERVTRAERELRRGLEDALADGRLDPGLDAPDGEPYEIVNLPSRYRELSLPPSDRTIHVNETRDAVRERLEDGSVREAAMAAAAVDEHREEIRRYVRDREEAIVERRREVETTLRDVRDLVDRLEGPLAERVDDFVTEGRHDDVDGVVEIERTVSDATRSLHRCSFDDAERELRTAREAADDLLVTVDFLGGLVGTIEHGSGTVALPDAVSTALMADLAPIIERQYDVEATVDGGTIAVVDRESAADGDDASRLDAGASRADDGRPGRESTAGAAGSRPGVATETVADEILFVLRELEGGGDGSTVRCQTEGLPDGVARPAVLEELAAFCRRQTDVVAAVDLQAGAPPGFLEVEFTERTTPSAGLETLRERFADRHGG